MLPQDQWPQSHHPHLVEASYQNFVHTHPEKCHRKDLGFLYQLAFSSPVAIVNLNQTPRNALRARTEITSTVFATINTISLCISQPLHKYISPPTKKIESKIVIITT